MISTILVLPHMRDHIIPVKKVKSPTLRVFSITVKPAVQINVPKAAPGGRYQDRKALGRKNQAVRKLERVIEETEREIERIKELMESPEIACDYTKLSELHDQLAREEIKLEEHLEDYVKEQRMK